MRMINIGSTAPPDSYQAWWPVKRKIATGAATIDILFLGDSTSDSVGELAYAIASTCFATVPEYSVDYYLFDFDAGSYQSAVRLQNGTGTGVIKFHNASKGGATLDEFTGRHSAAIATSADMIIINHGHNYNANISSGATGFSQQDTYFRLDESIEDIIRLLPQTPILISLQNPSQADLTYVEDIRSDKGFRDIAAARKGVSLVDIRSIYLNAGKPSAWYLNDVHPTTTGHAAAAAEHERCFRASKGRFTTYPQPRSTLVDATSFDAKNLLANGRFTGAFSSGTPASWTKVGTGTSADETSNVGYLSGHSVKLSDNVRLQQAVSDTNLAAIKGKDVVLAALLKVDGGDQNTTAGIFRLSGGAGGADANGTIATAGAKICWPRHGYPYANGGYAWKFFYDTIPFGAASGSVTALVYGSQTAGNGRYALWNAVGLFLRTDFEKFKAWS